MLKKSYGLLAIVVCLSFMVGSAFAVIEILDTFETVDYNNWVEKAETSIASDGDVMMILHNDGADRDT